MCIYGIENVGLIVIWFSEFWEKQIIWRILKKKVDALNLYPQISIAQLKMDLRENNWVLKVENLDFENLRKNWVLDVSRKIARIYLMSKKFVLFSHTSSLDRPETSHQHIFYFCFFSKFKSDFFFFYFLPFSSFFNTTFVLVFFIFMIFPLLVDFCWKCFGMKENSQRWNIELPPLYSFSTRKTSWNEKKRSFTFAAKDAFWRWKLFTIVFFSLLSSLLSFDFVEVMNSLNKKWPETFFWCGYVRFSVNILCYGLFHFVATIKKLWLPFKF